MRHAIIITLFLLATVFPKESFSKENSTYIGKNVALNQHELIQIKTKSSFYSSSCEAKLIESQRGKWSFCFDIPVELYVIVRQNSQETSCSDTTNKLLQATFMHDFMLERATFKAEDDTGNGLITKRYFEQYSFYDNQNNLTKKTSTDTAGIFYARTEITTSRGLGFSGCHSRYFSKLLEDETDVSIDHVFGKDIEVILGKEYQIYKIYKKEDEFISISILFKKPKENPLSS